MRVVPRLPSCTLEERSVFSRHVHIQPYAALVLDGAYCEAGEEGRWQVEAGDVLLHAPFSVHCNFVATRGAKVINLPLAAGLSKSACGSTADPDFIVKVARRDPKEAATALISGWRPRKATFGDLADLIAGTLSTPNPPSIDVCASMYGVSRATLFRQFRAAFGVAPTAYRVEARARRAWQMITEGATDLASIAAAVGYADQAHMNFDVKAFSGQTPGFWRSRALQQTSKTGCDSDEILAACLLTSEPALAALSSKS